MVQAQVLELLAELQRDQRPGAAVHHPRPVGADDDVRAAGGDVRRADRRGRPEPATCSATRCTRTAAALASAFPTIGDPASRIEPERPRRRPARPGRPAVGLPFRPTLRPGDRRVLRPIDVRSGHRRARVVTRRACTSPAWSAVPSMLDLAPTRAAPRSSDRVQGRRLVTYAAASCGPSTACRSTSGRGEVRRARRRVGVRQDDADPQSILGLEPLSGGTITFDGSAVDRPPAFAAGAAAPGADGLPGPDRRAQPAPHRLRGGRRRHPHPQGRRQRGRRWSPTRCRGPGCARRSGSCRATRTRSPAASASGC